MYALLHMGPGSCICQRMRLHMHTRQAYDLVCRLLSGFPAVCTAAYGPSVLLIGAYAAAYAHPACIPSSMQVAPEHCLLYAFLQMGPGSCICQRMRLHMHMRHAYHLVCRLLGAIPCVCTSAFGPRVLHMPAYAAVCAQTACTPSSAEHSLLYALLQMDPRCCLWERMRLHMHTRHAYHLVCRLLEALLTV
jgi:hypothetical protein